MKRILCLIGPPGVGKGTFASKFVAENLDSSIQYLSVGHELRKILSDSSGNLAKLELVEAIMTRFLSGGEKFIVDGYPRDLAQLENLVLRPGKIMLVNLQLADREILYNRLLNRYTCNLCGRTGACMTLCEGCNIELEMRPDDANLEAIGRRIDIYNREIVGIEAFCQMHRLPFFNFDVSNQDWIDRVNNIILNFFGD